MVWSKARGGRCKDTMDVLHLHWVFIHLKGKKRGGRWEDGERREAGRKRREEEGREDEVLRE